MVNLYDSKEECSGCTACKCICPKEAIKMEADAEGFLYPVINSEDCIECGLCKQVCPFRNGYKTPQDNPQFGVYAVKNKSNEIRAASTSGGMFTAISDFVLEGGGAVFGAVFDKDLKVIHKKAETKKERSKLRGSKYVQSDLQRIFCEAKQCLDNDQLVLFTGTPCQTAGLFSFLDRTKTDKAGLYMCDLVCHGTPSPLVWKEYIDFLSNKYRSRVIDYNFRYLWRGINVQASFENGGKVTNGADLATYMNIFFLHTALRPSCHNCKFCNFSRPSDITIADYWGIENAMPEFVDDLGVSLVMVNSEKGRELFENIEYKLVYRVSNTTDCIQPNLEAPSWKSDKREDFWKDFHEYGYLYVAKKYGRYDFISRYKYAIKKTLKSIYLIKNNSVYSK